jgi:hypothetical protein
MIFLDIVLSSDSFIPPHYIRFFSRGKGLHKENIKRVLKDSFLVLNFLCFYLIPLARKLFGAKILSFSPQEVY